MIPRQARLQRRLLGELLPGPAPTAAHLARTLGVSRPAASRSLHALANRGLVSHRGRTWSISPAGKAEIGRQSTANAETIYRAIEQTIRSQGAISQAIGTAIASTGMRAFGSGLHVADIAAASTFGSGLRVADVAAASTFDAGLRLGDVAQAVLPFAEARISAIAGLNVQIGALAKPLGWWAPIVAGNLATSGQIAADLAAMTNAGEALVTRLGTSRLETLVGEVVESHHQQLSSAISQLIDRPAAPGLASALTLPTRTTSTFTEVARDVVIPRIAEDRAERLRDPVLSLAADLEAQGAPRAAQDLRDAWSVLQRRDPGWSKAGAHLIRETLRGTLDELAPPGDVPRDANGFVTKRAQILWIVNDNETLAEWAEVTASNVGKLHSLLSAEAKNSGRPRIQEQGLSGLLQVAMGVLDLLLEQAADARR